MHTLKIAAISLLAGTASAQFWTTDFGLAEGISNTGVATGSFGTANGDYFIWDSVSGPQSIGGVSVGNGVGGQAKISNDGRYIAGTTFNASEGWHEMSRYDVTTGTWEGFGMLPGFGQQIDAEVTSGWNISGDGRSVVGLGWTNLGTADAHASQWTEGVGLVSLGSNAVGQSSRANGVNGDGSVVVGWQDGAGRQGSVWVNGTQELIFTDTSAPAQEALAVSNDGRYATGIGVGGFFDPGFAYRYDIELDTYESLPQLEVGAERTMAGTAITSDGSIIVGGTWGLGPATFGTGFVWVEGMGTLTVPEFLDMNGVSYDANYTFNFVSDISPDGQWLTGWGTASGFAANESFIIHIPAPASLGVMGLGLFGVRRRR